MHLDRVDAIGCSAGGQHLLELLAWILGECRIVIAPAPVGIEILARISERSGAGQELAEKIAPTAGRGADHVTALCGRREMLPRALDGLPDRLEWPEATRWRV